MLCARLELTDEQAVRLKALVVGTEEDGGEEVEQDYVVLLYHKLLILARLVNADEHVVLGGELQELRTLLLSHGDKGDVLKALGVDLAELGVVGDGAGGCLVVVEIGIVDLTRHDKVEIGFVN